MKKIAFVASLAITTLAFTAFVAPKASTEKSFEGEVTYSISVDNPQAAAQMQGWSVNVFVKGGKTKSVVDMGMAKQITIQNKQTPDDPIFLVESMDNKYQIKNDKDKDKEAKDPAIKYMDGTKKIAGYNCHKAEITTTGKDGAANVTTVFYTEELPALDDGDHQFKGLKGFPLEYSLTQQGMNLTMSATKVEKKSLTDDTFTVPTGYKLVTQQEMVQDMQKSMGDGGGN